jgi:hypothetical protein
MLKQTLDEKLAQQAKFIFKGTVEKLKASTIPSVPLTDKTTIVRVDEILRAPEPLSYYGGQRITVQLGSREQLKKDEQAIFYTNSWIVGESLAVQSVGHTAVDTGSKAAQKKGRAASAASDEADPTLQGQVADADAVVVGKVTSVRVLDEPSASGASNAASTKQYQSVSEHSPVWHEAVIEVEDVEKGSNIPKQVLVRFPSSTDVLWYDAPKFQTGQEGVFLLRKESKKTEPKVRLASKVAAPTRGKAAPKIYTALDATAIQPLQKVETIRSLIKGAK